MRRKKRPQPKAKPTPETGKHRERRCVATGETLPEQRLIRFALGPDGALHPDLAAKLPGRGAWVSASRTAISCCRPEARANRRLAIFNDTMKMIRITAPSNTNSMGRTLPTNVSCSG